LIHGPKLFPLGCLQSQFYAVNDKKISFPKLHGPKISKFRFRSVFDTEMVTKFFQNSNCSNFLGIKSEINDFIFSRWHKLLFFSNTKRCRKQYFYSSNSLIDRYWPMSNRRVYWKSWHFDGETKWCLGFSWGVLFSNLSNDIQLRLI